MLVHGYGASSYHWRYNIPALADAGYKVFAVDLLGFGYSEKVGPRNLTSIYAYMPNLSSPQVCFFADAARQDHFAATPVGSQIANQGLAVFDQSSLVMDLHVFRSSLSLGSTGEQGHEEVAVPAATQISA